MRKVYLDEPELSLGDRFGQAFANIGQMAGQAIPQYLMGRQQVLNQEEEKKKQLAQMHQENEAAKRLGIDISGIYDPKIRQAAVEQALKQAGEEKEFGRKTQFLNQVQGMGAKKAPGQAPVAPGSEMGAEQEEGPPFDPSLISDEQILALAAVDPAMARETRMAKDTALKQKSDAQKRERDTFESDRAYHASFTKDTGKEVDKIRATIPIKERSLYYAEDAVINGDQSFFSGDNLAEMTGVDLFRTAKGQQLVLAGKENLLSNMARTSAKAQNLWFEQRLNSMFLRTGLPQEANLMMAKILKGELEAEKAYVEEYDRLAAEDIEKYGFEKKDIETRARANVSPAEKEIFRRTIYQMKEIEEMEMGVNEMKKKVGKPTAKGTPLTFSMMRLYADKFGDKALDKAKKDGYYIPTLEEFKIFQQKDTPFDEQVE